MENRLDAALKHKAKIEGSSYESSMKNTFCVVEIFFLP